MLADYLKMDGRLSIKDEEGREYVALDHRASYSFDVFGNPGLVARLGELLPGRGHVTVVVIRGARINDDGTEDRTGL